MYINESIYAFKLDVKLPIVLALYYMRVFELVCRWHQMFVSDVWVRVAVGGGEGNMQKM
jgi:hypothetical protein